MKDEFMPEWLKRKRAEAQAVIDAYKLKHPGHVSGEPTFELDVVLGGQGGIVPLMQRRPGCPRLPLGRYVCFWVGDK
jgi:hypothetical protein